MVNPDRLETPLQGCVFFDMFAIFVDRGRPDTLQLAPGQHWLQQVTGVHRSFCRPGADDGVQLVDKEDNFTLSILDLF